VALPDGVTHSRPGPLVVILKVKLPLAGAISVPAHRAENPKTGTALNAGDVDPPGADPFHANLTRTSRRVNDGTPDSVELAKYAPVTPPAANPCACAPAAKQHRPTTTRNMTAFSYRAHTAKTKSFLALVTKTKKRGKNPVSWQKKANKHSNQTRAAGERESLYHGYRPKHASPDNRKRQAHIWLLALGCRGG
jgi:hypothetical protein